MEPILTSIITLSSLGAVASIGLGIASKILKVKENPLIAQINDILPGANCGGCGYPGCSNYAKAIVEDKADTTLCAPGSNEVIKKISEILGKEIEEKEQKIAWVHCYGHNSVAEKKCSYKGIQSCIAATLLNGGDKECSYGCLGFGDCVEACPFDAIHIGKKGLPVVDKEKCTGCGKCVSACPKNIITLENKNNRVSLMCSSKDFGKEVRSVCSIGCIGCGICAKKCPKDALTMINNLPVWDWSKCINCKICSMHCPQDIIFFKGEPLQKPKLKTQESANN